MVLRRCLARSKFDTTALPSVVLWVVDFFALFHEILYFCNFTPLNVVPDLSNSFQHSTRINTKVQALPIEGKPPSNLTSRNLGVFFRWWQQKLHCFIMKPVRQVLVISSFRPTRQTWRWGTLKIVWAAFWRSSLYKWMMMKQFHFVWIFGILGFDYYFLLQDSVDGFSKTERMMTFQLLKVSVGVLLLAPDCKYTVPSWSKQS